MSKSNIVRTLRVILFIFATVAMLIFIQFQINKSINRNQIEINDQWSVTMDGKTNDNVDLSKMFFSDIRKGETITISRVLSEEGYRLSSISMLLRYSMLEVYLDQELLATFNQENFEKGDLLGNGIIWVGLPDDFQGKNLSMRFTFGEDDAFTSFDRITLMNSEKILQIFLGERIFSIVIISFLLLFGFFSILAGINLRKSDERNQLLIALGTFAWSAGLWMFCNTRLSSAFIEDFSISGTMEYCSLYGAYISMVVFLWMIIEKPLYKLFFKVWGCVLSAMSVVLFVLNYFNILHYPATVHVFQGSGVISIICACVVLVRSLKEHGNAKTIQSFIMGIVMFLLFSILELARYRYNHMVSPNVQLGQSFIPFGVALFICFMFISFLISMYNQIYTNIEQKKLYDMAYVDHLTGLRNRAWCDKVMRRFEREAIPVSILNFDLDCFKDVNDTYGHLSGDELLKCFGRCLSSVFREADCVGRMGGDEFVVILKYVEEERLRKRVEELEQRIAKENENLTHGQIRFSVGIATSKGKENVSIWKLYEQADRQMYVQKQERR